ncbi:hypothetical protein CDD81_4970 [Ophiocordyceps australis]|uniref:Uncharacterized protein n=1 Tax=Ophiocordyceps australis TaxID=1399860 RepID=A0A2C5Y3N0_9HYPO|nr:hypothetical protein CDD81_4970 [Ophiocordyceps australis]
MFSAAASEGGPATATRSRRRQRPKSSDNLVQQPKTKRARIPLPEQPPSNPDGHASSEATDARPDRTISKTEASMMEGLLQTSRREGSVRSKKPKHADRAASKGDGSLVLSITNAFTVAKLPALPDRIKTDWSVQQHAQVFAWSGYVLSLTLTHAFIWPYGVNTQSPETFIFTLPPASKPNDPLPVGCLVSPSAASAEPGLVVVMAGSGRVIYWESISSAATFAFIKRERSDVEDCIPGLKSGERAVAMTGVDSAGFILTFNTGRLAYMGVRDGHGRPSISVQFLATNLPISSSGIFGSIRHAFSNLSLRSEIVAVRTDLNVRGAERTVVSLSSKCRLQSWKVHRGGHNEFMAQIDAREQLAIALQDSDGLSQDFPVESFEAIDFSFVPKGLEAKYANLSRLSDAMVSDDASMQHLLLLVSLTNQNASRYALMEVILTPRDIAVGMIRPLSSYSTPLPPPGPTQGVQPRIYLPRPALVAFVVFDHAAVIASVAVPPESPESQLRADSQIVPMSFEDVVHFQGDEAHEVLGSGYEEAPPVSQGHDEARSTRHKAKNPAVLVLARNAGVIRILTTDVDRFASEQPPRVSAKSKLEQAVFFGAQKDNPLSFEGRQNFEFGNKEMANAACELSLEILKCETPYLSTVSACLEEHIAMRSAALERLISHLNATGVRLDRVTRWTLLYNAEKMHAAGFIWKRHQNFLASRSATEHGTLIGSVIDIMNLGGPAGQQKVPVREKGEVDKVRFWFARNIHRLELLVAWCYELIKIYYSDGSPDWSGTTELMDETIQLNIIVQTAAREFRGKNLGLYGLGRDQLRMGMLRDGYEGIPEPWTGEACVSNNMKRLTELCENWLRAHDEWPRTASDADRTPNSDPAVLAAIRPNLPELADCMLISVLEHARWATVNSDNKSLAQEFVKAYDAERRNQPLVLAEFGFWDQAAKIAEKHGCLAALATVLLEHISALESQLAEPKLAFAQIEALSAQRSAKKAKLEDCFAKYGEPFAFPIYDCLLEKGGVGAIMAFDLDTLGFKTRFLRSRPNLARVSWMNDVLNEKDMGHAADTLVDMAVESETHLWRKKIALSLGKLVLIAEGEGASPQKGQTLMTVKHDEHRRQQKLERVANALSLVKIQDLLYGQVFQTTYDAIDGAAALSFAIEAHSTNIPRRQKALLQLFTDGVEKLLDHEVLDPLTLIDLLTLIFLGPEAKAVMLNPFWLALKAAQCACSLEELRDVKRLIWRRLYTRDDWTKLNDTLHKDDAEVITRLADTEMFAMFVDCVRYQDERDPFRYMPPQEALGVYTESLDDRFHAYSEPDQAKLLDAMRAEDKTLAQHLERAQLADWAAVTLDAAQKEVRNIQDDATASDAQHALDLREPLALVGRRPSAPATNRALLFGAR